MNQRGSSWIPRSQQSDTSTSGQREHSIISPAGGSRRSARTTEGGLHNAFQGLTVRFDKSARRTANTVLRARPNPWGYEEQELFQALFGVSSHAERGVEAATGALQVPIELAEWRKEEDGALVGRYEVAGCSLRLSPDSLRPTVPAGHPTQSGRGSRPSPFRGSRSDCADRAVPPGPAGAPRTVPQVPPHQSARPPRSAGW